MNAEAQKYEACATRLKEVLAQYVPANPALFSAAPRDPKRYAIYAEACGLAEAAIVFAVLSEGADFDSEKVREQAKGPRWVAEQSREVLAQLFRKREGFDDGR